MSARRAGWAALAGLIGWGALALPARAQQQVSNTARAVFQTPGGMDSTVSNTVQTTLIRPVATLQVTVLGATSLRPGDTVQYRIAYANPASAAIRNAVLTDSLPAGLEYRSATPAPTLAGPVVRWNLGDLQPGSSGDVFLTLAVAASLRDTLRVRNAVSLASANADEQIALAPEIQLLGTGERGIALELTADLLEVSLGETAPFTLVISNPGSAPLRDLVARLFLPDGARSVPGSFEGADSVRLADREVILHVAGPLDPGASRRIRYSVALASAEAVTLATTGYVTSQEGDVRSPDAVAWLRVRSAAPMENRTVIGRVWVDLDGNGVAGKGETGPDGIEIWTDDGEVASTDSTGRFSFRNIRPGRRGFRLDPASVPAGFRIAADQELVTLDATGWTTPVVNFRLVPRAGRLVSVRVVPAPLDPGTLVPVAAAVSEPGWFPDPDSLPPNREVALVLAPPAMGWPGEASFPLPPGWVLAPGQDGATLLRDRSGVPVIWWRNVSSREEPVVARLVPAPEAA
ncbi:MAG TPA: hypothetical protein VI383_01390, partial [Gemmatimonadales bacterium]|nr:hypothetical protein [Gemmatimonadales bacterium]